MKNTPNKLKVIYGDATLGVKGDDYRYIFSYATGGLESLHACGKEWLYRTPKPTFWRALTDNDRGNGFHLRSGMWVSADQFIGIKDRLVEVDGKKLGLPIAPDNNEYSQKEYAEEVKVTFVYETITVPSTEVKVEYQINADGKIRVKVQYKGQEGLPEMPVFGLRFILPTVAERYQYEGLSGETYPDRKAGGVPGIYTVEGLPVTPYLVPQDCGMHMDTSWVEITRKTELDNRNKEWKETSLRVSMDEKPFAFSCLPYTSLELEQATHQEELPLERRTVLCVYGAVRGVGGIDSWGADVEEPYHIDATKDMEFSFVIEPVKG